MSDVPEIDPNDLDGNARSAWQRLKDEAKAAQDEAVAVKAQLAALQTEQRKLQADAVFKEAGALGAKFYPADAELSKEKVLEWATAEGFLAQPSPPSSSPLVGSVPGAISTGTKQVSRAEVSKLMESDPAEALRLMREGLVETRA